MAERSHRDGVGRGAGAALASLPFCRPGSALSSPGAAAQWGSGPRGVRGARSGAGGAVAEPCPCPPAAHAERLGTEGPQLRDEGEHPHLHPS